MEQKELIPISANDFYKIVDAPSILEAVKFITDKNISLKQSTKYSVIINNEPFPPKEVMRISANLKGYEIDENTLFGGQVNKPFEKFSNFQAYLISNRRQILINHPEAINFSTFTST